MKKNDLQKVLSIESACFSDPWTEKDFKKCEKQGCSLSAVIYEDEIIGFMVYQLNETFIHLLNFAVTPEMQKHGVGTQMVIKLKSKLGRGRRIKILLVVQETNLGAQLFFHNQGFLAVNGTLKDHFGEGKNAYLMEFAIKPPMFMGKNRMREYLP